MNARRRHGRAAAPALPRGRAVRAALSRARRCRSRSPTRRCSTCSARTGSTPRVELGTRRPRWPRSSTSRPSRGRAWRSSARGCTPCATRRSSAAPSPATRCGASSESYTAGYQDVDRPHAFRANRRSARREPAAPALAPPAGSPTTSPRLTQFTVANKGLDEAPASLLLTGLPGGPESVPVIANLTTGEAVLFLGNVAAGRAALAPRPAPTARWRAGSRAATSPIGLRSVDRHRARARRGRPPKSWRRRARSRSRRGRQRRVVPARRPLRRARARPLPARAGRPRPHAGPLGRGEFDHSALLPATRRSRLTVGWVEAEPASFEVRLPVGRAPPAARPRATLDDARDELAQALALGSRAAPAAGVRSAVSSLAVLRDAGAVGPHHRCCRCASSEVGRPAPTGMPDAGGLFERDQLWRFDLPVKVAPMRAHLRLEMKSETARHGRHPPGLQLGAAGRGGPARAPLRRARAARSPTWPWARAMPRRATPSAPRR